MKTKKEKKRLRKIIEGDIHQYREDDIVYWTYRHTLNSKSSTMITKKGIFVRAIKSSYRDGGFSGDITIFCLVQFNGNKNPSKIRISELEIINPC